MERKGKKGGKIIDESKINSGEKIKQIMKKIRKVWRQKEILMKKTERSKDRELKVT